MLFPRLTIFSPRFHNATTSNSRKPASILLAKPVSWSLPPVDTYKLNTDASLKTQLGLIDLGAIVRDSTASVLLSWAQKLSQEVDVDFAEALALKLGLILVKRLAFGISRWNRIA
ncbi:hypothetical protein ACOSQ2_012329 [Xanthoceras sorbifolium]